jgi:hypothetical protein
MKPLQVNFKDQTYNLIEEAAKLRSKSLSDMVDEIVSDYFFKEKKTEAPQIVFDESKEVWKDIPGFEGLYQASNMGRIASIRYGFKLMSLVRNPTGYLQIAFRVNNSIKRGLVHVFVAKTFLDQCDGCTQVDHINHVKTDNRVENLQWISRSDNMKNNYSRGITSVDKLRSKGKRVELFDKNGKSIGIFDKLRDAAKYLGVQHGNLSALVNGKHRVKSLTKDKITAKLIN